MNRWFILPITTSDNEIQKYPKYTRKDGISGYSGKVLDFEDPKWDGFPMDLPFDNKRYVVNVHGDESALDDISSEADSHTMPSLGVTEETVAEMLNEQFPQNRSFDEWSQSMRVQ